MGWHSPFFFGAANGADETMATNLGELLARTVPPLGYELVDWESTPKGRLVRVFIDKAGGVDVEDCARLSQHLTRLFAVENVDYDRLEVSSPGLDRPLKTAADYERFRGQEATLVLREKRNDSRKVRGVLSGLDGADALVETADGTVRVPLEAIERARLVPKIEWRKQR
jgi:ribosome maturation factor RimP